jgi:FkbM family methyltransferase
MVGAMANKLIHMLAWSLRTDYILLFRIPGISKSDSVIFILLKYYHYLRDVLLGSPQGGRSVSVFGRRYHYNDPYGLASLQRVYCEHYGLKGYVGESPVVIDVGAHIGQFNFFCAHYLKASRVISIEPIRDCYALLKMNALNAHDCINMAAGGEGSLVTMHVSQTSTQQSTYVKSSSDRYSGQFDIAMETLDAVLRRIDVPGAIDVLKIDTEGSEYDILCHAEKMLLQTRLVAVEMSVLRNSTGSIFRTGTMLEDHGFALREIDCFRPVNTSAANAVFEKASSDVAP